MFIKYLKAWCCLIVLWFFKPGDGCYAQFNNGDKSIRDSTLKIAEFMLQNNRVNVSPAEALKYLESPMVNKIAVADRLPESSRKHLDGASIYSASKDAVGWVAMCYRKRSSGGAVVNGASAFVISPGGVCVTNYHVLYAFANDKGLDGTGIFLIRLGNGKVYALDRILYTSVENDVAVLQLETKKGEKLPCLSFENKVPNIGEDAYMIGNPRNLYFAMTKGIVADLYSDAIAWPNGKGGSQRDLMAITADFAVGASGSPILNDRGNIIGMVSSTNVIESNNNGYPLTQMVVKNAIPNTSLLRALAAVGLNPSRSEK